MREVIWAPAADRDLGRAHEYLMERSPSAARRLALAVLRALESLLDHPELGPVLEGMVPEGRYRRLVVGHHLLVYRFDEATIYILRFWDARQDPASFSLPMREE